jgi:hypothetical protein
VIRADAFIVREPGPDHKRINRRPLFEVLPKTLANKRRVVGVREADHEEEGLLRLCLAVDELDRRVGDVTLDLPTVVYV